MEKVESSRTSTSTKKTEITSVSVGKRMLTSFRRNVDYRISYSNGKATVQRGTAYSVFGTDVSKVIDSISAACMGTGSKTVSLPSSGVWYVRVRTVFAVPEHSVQYRTKWSAVKKVSVK